MQKMLVTIKIRVGLVVTSFLCLSIPWLTLADPALARQFNVVKITEVAEIREPQINNLGQIVWLGAPDDDPTGNHQIFQYTPGGGSGSIRQVTSGRGYMFNLRLNSRGQMVWVEAVGLEWHIYLYAPDPGGGPGTITLLSAGSQNNDNPQINDQGQVVWQGRNYEVYPTDYIFLYNNTFPAVMMGNGWENKYPQINAGGQIVWQGRSDNPDPDTGQRGYEIFFSPDGGATQTDVSADYHYNLNPQINSRGEIIWQKGKKGGGQPYDVYLAQGGVLTPLASGYLWYPYPVIGNNGEATWVGHWLYASGYCFYSQGVITGLGQFLSSSSNPLINALGQVAYIPEIHDGSGLRVCLYDHGKTAILSPANTPVWSPQINDRGAVIWLQTDTPGQAALYLASPVGQGFLPGMLSLLLGY
jgi:hypothetical protein